MEMEKGVQRWVVDIAEWEPSSDDFSQAMALLPHHEYASITRFVKLEDRKRALVSRLLQYALVHQVLGITFDDIVIRRTPEGKPFLVGENVKLGFPNFNFNVSHHAEKFIESFSSYFSSLEWYCILNAGSSDEMLKTFYRFLLLLPFFPLPPVFNKSVKIFFEETNSSNIKEGFD
ncbi:hypothetical protein Sango_0765100 [Sesamum angolense]|uniref:holo-[acyl-carrier-protein] synthase n=1 Tax=Sesamum angolense TaxID=2727404 RepID=A0AAE1X2B7_9LAMI|nr:hypothetical protein Sango_0765100 [Sesamum angolense]